MITPARVYEIASQWGSYCSAGEPGVPFVSFYANDGTPVSPGHQESCIRYTIDLLGRDLQEVDRSDLIALLYFFDQTAPRSMATPQQPGGEPDLWAT